MLYRSVLAANVHIDLSTLLFKSHIYNIDSNRHVCITVHTYIKGILSTKIVICSYPKLLSFSVLTFIKWRLTPSYAAKDTIFWQKKTQNYRYQNYCRMTIFKLFIWPSMWTRLEHAHCLETINNMWFLGKRESVNSWNKADFDGFREKDE